MNPPGPSYRQFVPLIWAFCAVASPAAEKVIGTLQVEPGAQARGNAVVSFEVPPAVRGPAIIAQAADGTRLPVQVDTSGSGWVRLTALDAGATTGFRLVQSDQTGGAAMAINVERLDRKLRISQEGRPIFEYQAEPGELPRPDIKEAFRRGGYLHPVTTPAGTVITDDFPPNHVHHHGIWFPWTKTSFDGREPDFWNMGEGKGRVEFVKLVRHWSGPVHGGFVAEHRFVDLLAPDGGKTVLNEKWTIRAYPAPTEPDAAWVFDLESVQTCATSQPLILPEYHYGGLGFRGHWDWNGADRTLWLTANGETDRIKGHATRADWCYIGGITGGKQGGIAILGHPGNFRAPQPMRIHPTEPFFCFAPQQLGEMRIEPGQPYVSRYRFVVLDGQPSKERIDAFWRDYTEPVKVTVKWD